MQFLIENNAFLFIIIQTQYFALAFVLHIALLLNEKKYFLFSEARSISRFQTFFARRRRRPQVRKMADIKSILNQS